MKKILLIFTCILVLTISCTKTNEVVIDGSSTVSPITIAIAEEFSEENPDINVAIGVSGTGGGMKKFTKGEVDIVNSSRHIKQAEIDEAHKNNIEYIELVVAVDGLTVAINKNNDWISDITIEELKKIWEEGSTIYTWKDLNPNYPDKKILLYSPDEDSGTFDYFIEAVIGKDGELRRDYSPSPDDNQLVQGIAGDIEAMGYFGYAYYFENKDELKALKINGIEPNAHNVRNGVYDKLSRLLYIYVNKDAFLQKEQVREFVFYYLNHAPELIPVTGYIPLNDYSDQIIMLEQLR